MKPFIAGFSFIFGGYLSMTCFLQYYFYGKNHAKLLEWKIQSQRSGGAGEIAYRCPR
jgi:hypothetical protein